MKVKDGVILAGLVPELDDALAVVEECYAQVGAECWITSGRDGVHHGSPVEGGTRDPHYEGKAVDVRLWNVPLEHRAQLIANIRDRLGPEYVVLWENRGQPGEHAHIQWGHVRVA